MLADIGLASLDELFEVVPEALRLAGGLDLAPGLSEPDVLAEMDRLAGRNRSGADLICFAGAGAYDHEVPSATRRLTFRSEFVTAYTPYQPEVAQGVLQALFEYQTLVARLAGLPIANASLYDGASAAVEAVNLAVAATGRQTVWVSGGLHPALAAGAGDLRPRHRPPAGRRPAPRRRDRLGGGRRRATLRPPCWWRRPNYLGALEDVRAARAAADQHGALLVVGFDPVSAGLLRAPGRGRRRRGGGGGPALRHARCRSAARTWGCSPAGWSRSAACPAGWWAGRSTPRGGPAYVTTLRAREQDIRREKASSNVCTNQTLIAVAAMIQLSWLGTTRPAGAGPALRPGHPLRPGGGAGHTRRVAPGPGADPPGVRPPAAGSGRHGRRPHGRRGIPGRRAGRHRRRAWSATAATGCWWR